jgi:hypothetical protein
MACNWTSPVEIPGGVAMALQTLLAKVDAFQLTAENLPAVDALNAEFKLVLDADTRQVAPLEPLVGFEWSWASRG